MKVGKCLHSVLCQDDNTEFVIRARAESHMCICYRGIMADFVVSLFELVNAP